MAAGAGDGEADAIRRVCVAGGGVVGLGILRGFVAAGFETWLLSRDPAVPKPGLPAGVRRLGPEPAGEPPDLPVESIPEERPLKRALLARVEDAWGGRCVLPPTPPSCPCRSWPRGCATRLVLAAACTPAPQAEVEAERAAVAPAPRRRPVGRGG